MKAIFKIFLLCLLAGACRLSEASEAACPLPPLSSSGDFKVETLLLDASFDKDNATYSMSFKLKAEGKCSVEMLSGPVVELSSKVERLSGSFWSWFPEAPKIEFRDGSYWLDCPEKGEYSAVMSFASKVSESNGVRSSGFSLMSALSRSLKASLDGRESELEVSGSLGLRRLELGAEAKDSSFEGALSPEGPFSAVWKRHVEKTKGGLVASLSSSSVYEVFPGAVKLSASYSYSVIQGRLQELKMEVPKELNVLSVSGQDIQDWRLDRSGEAAVLVIKLSREFEGSYALRLEAEMLLPAFPSKFSLPCVAPRDVIKHDGQISFGTNRAIRLLVESVDGLNQVDNAPAPAPLPTPRPLLSKDGKQAKDLRVPPAFRSLYSYQTSSSRWSLSASADNISPVCALEMNCVVTVKDEDLSVKALLELDIKDAPLKELLISYDPSLSVGRVEGDCLRQGDYELVKRGEARFLRLPLKPDTQGKALITVLFDKSIRGASSFAIPSIAVEGMKSSRGYLLLAAGRGLSLQASGISGLKEALIGSAPIKEPGLQLVYRFKDEPWRGALSVKRERTSIVSDVLHLESIGESSVYGSSMFTYHISGAPVDKISFLADASLRNLEFTGRDIVDWKKDPAQAAADGRELWTLTLRDKILGDATVLATYELPLKGPDFQVRLGAVSTVGADSEGGYIAVGSQRNLSVVDVSLPDSVRPAEASELPDEYRKLAANPLVKAYRCLKSPHWADVVVKAYPEERPLGAIVEMTSVKTRIDRNGEAQTVVEYRVKNSNRQFLPLKMPESAKLWTVTVDGGECRTSVAEGGLLVPLPGRQDINVPVAVSLRYTQMFGELGSGRSVELKAPAPGVESMFCKWSVDAPADYRLVSPGGSMTPEAPVQVAGFAGFAGLLLSWLSALASRSALAGLVLLSFGGFIIAAAFGSDRLKILGSVLGALLVLASLPCLLPLLSFHSEAAPFAVSHIDFARSYFLPGDAPAVSLGLESMKGLSASKLLFSVAALAASLILCALSFKGGRFGAPLLLGFACAGFVLAGCQWRAFNELAAPLAAAFLVLLLLSGFWTLVYMLLRGARASSSVAALLLALACAGPSLDAAEPASAPAFDLVKCDVKVFEKAVRVHGEWSFKTDGEALLWLLGPSASISSSSSSDPGSVELVRSGDSYALKVKSSGEYRFEADFLVPFKKDSGSISLSVPLAFCRSNEFNVETDRESMEIVSPNAVRFSHESSGGLWKAKASFAPGSPAEFVLRPQQRSVEDEPAQLFARVDGSAKFMPGFVEVSYLCSLQIAQGQALGFRVEAPEGMRVVSVEAPDLGAWSFDPAKRELSVSLSRPHSGDYAMTVVAQLPCGPFPSKSVLSTLSFPEAARQYGSLGLFGEAGMQLEVLKEDGFSLMNNADFGAFQGRGHSTLKKAYRFFKVPCSLQVEASAAQPEIRVSERSSVNFEEERCSISSKLDVEVAKAGIFSLSIEIPKGFDVDKLSGEGVQHWDEVSDASGQRALVSFSRRMLGPLSLELSLSRMGRLKDGAMSIPRVCVAGAARLEGELSVTVERGVRMDLLKRQGAEPKPSSAAKSFRSSTHSFSLHRVDWSLDVSFSAAEPWVQAESLQTARFSESSIDCSAVFNCSIENAGVKAFRVKLPAAAEAVEFSGQGVLSFAQAADGAWEVELGQKTGREFKLSCRYRLPYGGAKASIACAELLGVQNLSGYYAVFAGEAGQMTLSSKEGTANEFDPRKVPASFKAGDLGGATLCFRTVGPGCSFEISTVRNKAAETLQAEVQSVALESVVPGDGMMVTKARVALSNGNQNFLKVKLPEGARFWSAFIDSQPVEAARADAGALLIPLRQGVAGRRAQNVEFIYSSPRPKAWSESRQSYSGPSFDLPLQNVSWTLKLPPGFKGSDFKGTLDHIAASPLPPRYAYGIPSSSVEAYDLNSKQLQESRLRMAKDYLDRGSSLAKAGRQKEAFEAFQSASNLSENDLALNTDIQGQWLETQRKQNVQAIANRRGDVSRKASPQAQQAAPVQFDSFDAVKAQMGGTELKGLQSISDKIFLQQRAATVAPHPLEISLPAEGESLRFERALQATPGAPMEVSFSTARSVEWKARPAFFAGLAFAGACFIGFLLYSLALSRRKA